MGISGNTDGDKTKLDSARKREQVKGQMGEGDSETETTHMPEGRQTAARTYREQYQKYRRMTEAALNSEPIPLGHRQTIRRYFELIRPQGDEAEKADAESAKERCTVIGAGRELIVVRAVGWPRSSDGGRPWSSDLVTENLEPCT